MYGPWWQRHRRHPHSLWGRLAFAFVMVSFVSLLVAFAALGSGRFGNGVHHPWSFFPLLPALAFAIGAGMFAARRMTRRLSRLREAAERLDLPQVPVEGDDEVAALARSFNRIVVKLEAEERARRQLFADVAHELRHPLAVLKGRLEMM